MVRRSSAVGALSLAAAGCLQPDGWSWPEREGLKTILVVPNPLEQGRIRAVPPAGAAPLNVPGGDFRAYGFELDLGALQLPDDRFFGPEGEACGRIGRLLPRSNWVFGPGEGSGSLADLEEDAPRLVGPIFDSARCREAGGAIHEVEESTVCLPSEALEDPPAPTAPAPAAWPTGCTGLSDCANERPPCPADRYYLSRRGGCEALAPCVDDVWPAEVTHWVAPGAVGGDGSLAAPFASITDAAAAGALVVGLLPGEHLAPQPLGGLTLVGVCAERTVLRLSAGSSLRRPARWARLTVAIGPGIMTAVNVDGSTLELEEGALIGDSNRAILVQNGGRLQARRLAISGFQEQLTIETSTAGQQQVALRNFASTGLVARSGASVTQEGAKAAAGLARGGC